MDTCRSPHQRMLRTLLLAVLLESPAVLAADGPWEKAQRECDRLREEGHYLAAESFCRQALNEAEQFGMLDPRLATSQSNLGTLYLRLGRVPEAESLFQRALETMQRQANPDVAELAAAWNNLGQIYLIREQLPEAENHFRRALAHW